MAITINEIKSGIGLILDGQVWLVTEFNHVKPGKGSAFVRVRLKSLKTGNVLERTFRSAETLEEAILENRRFQFQYQAGDDYHFMDQNTFDEQIVSAEMLGDGVKYLQDSMIVEALCYKGQILRMDMPNFIIATITESEPGIKGDSSRSGYKPATIDTGAVVQVPLFIEAGEVIKVDTRTGTYVERVRK